jgi:hypothetical protein
MNLNRKTGRVVAALLFMITSRAWAYEEVEDLVDIVATGGYFTALVDGQRNFSEARRSNEKILWQGAKGEVGAFLTNERLLAVSVRSGQWNTRYLKIKEKKGLPEVLISAHLVVMLTAERIVGFGTHTGGFIQTRMPLGEPVVDRAAEGRVAVVITPTRAFGFSTYRRGIAEVRFRRQETMVSLKATYNLIRLRTSQRLITLKSEEAVWRQFDLK